MRKGMRVVVVILLAACFGLGAYLVTRPKHPAEAPPPAHTAPPSAQKPAPAPAKLKVYRVALKNNQPVLCPTEVEAEPGKNPAETALTRLIEQGEGADLANPIPEGTRLLGLKVENGLATVDLSREFKANFAGGSEQEGLTIGAILRTLGQFPEIKRVQILVEGKTIDSLGHLDLSGPLGVDWVGSEYGGGN